jgi:prevent-host-death family protein
MKRASISEAKNGLSALLDRVRQGQTVVIEDRGVPVARLEPIVPADDADGRIARLQRQGAVRAPVGRLSAAWLKAKPPRLIKGRKASEIILEERDSSR